LSGEVVRAIIEAVSVDGFKPTLVGDGLHLEGHIAIDGRDVPLRITFEDLSLAEAPRLYVPDISTLRRKVVPHLEISGELCVADRRLNVFDRHRAPEQVRGLIIRARETLTRGMTRQGTAEIADEFTSYWSDTYTPLDERHVDVNLAYVTTAKVLSFEVDQDRPTTLGELVQWANHWDTALGNKIIAAFARLTAKDPMVVIRAANASVAATIRMSARAKIAETLSRQKAWGHYVRSRAGLALPIIRTEARAVDLETIFAANGEGGRAPLAGKTILLIGCGAIGGYLARMLAQLGAGLGEGKLMLVDADELEPANTRRHQLGLDDVLRRKAEACAEAIKRDFPGLTIIPQVDDAQKHAGLLAAADLVIDATGEQGLGEWLNSWWLQRHAEGKIAPALLYTWVNGLGAAAQSFLQVDATYACYRCLQPDLALPGRFDPLRTPPPAPLAGCGRQLSTPYGPAAPMMAASLAASHATDWAGGHGHHLLRTVRLDWAATVKRDPLSPSKADLCPACGGAKPAAQRATS